MENLKYSVSFVIPIFNEEGNIETLYKEIINVANKISSDYEIIFVDDGSRDKSQQIIKNLASNDKNVRYIFF